MLDGASKVSGNRAESRSGWGRESADQAYFGQGSRPARTGHVLADQRQWPTPGPRPAGRPLPLFLARRAV